MANKTKLQDNFRKLEQELRQTRSGVNELRNLMARMDRQKFSRLV